MPTPGVGIVSISGVDGCHLSTNGNSNDSIDDLDSQAVPLFGPASVRQLLNNLRNRTSDATNGNGSTNGNGNGTGKRPVDHPKKMTNRP
jgi:hypothetical protein